jgi:uncharacterized membrane protein
MPGRPISDKLRCWLLGEMEVWRGGGLLSEEQTGRILDGYESPAEAAGRKRSLAVFALMGVAALLVGLAVLLLIAYNWERTPKELKLAGNLTAIAATYGLAFLLRYRWKARLLSEVAFFLGCLLFGAGIWLVAQVFHVQAHFPSGIWLWALGVLPLAICLDTLLLHALLAALLAVWVGCEIIGFPHLGAWLFGRWSHVPNGAYTLPLLALPGVLWAYRQRSPVTLAMYVLVLAWWVVLQPVAWHADQSVVYFIGAAGALFLVLAESHAPGSEMAAPYRNIGVLMCAGILILLSFLDFNMEMQQQRRLGLQDVEVTSLVATVAVAVLGLVTAVLAARVRPTGRAAHADLSDSVGQGLMRHWLPIGMVLLMVGLSLWNALLPVARTRGGWYHVDRGDFRVVVPTVLANVALVTLAIWLMRTGLREDRARPFAAGVILFVAWAVMRYIDLFGDLGGMLGASLMFFLCGAALFGLAMYWRRRKEVRDV